MPAPASEPGGTPSGGDSYDYDAYWREGVSGWDVVADLSPHLAALLVDVVSARDVLDFGGGDGQRYGGLIREHARSVTVADASPMILARRAALGDATLDVSRLDDDPETFDVLVALEVLEHLVDPLGALRSVVAKLRPGGRAVISVPNAFSLVNRLRMLTGRLPSSGVGTSLRGQTYVAPHIRFFDLASLVALAEAAGLSVERVMAHDLDLWKVSGLVRRTGFRPLRQRGRSPLLAGTFVLVARLADPSGAPRA